MKKSKLSLTKFKVTSFVTTVPTESQQTLKAGFILVSAIEDGCPSAIPVECTSRPGQCTSFPFTHRGCETIHEPECKDEIR